MAEIKCFRLITGEDIIAKCEYSHVTGKYTLINPLQITVMPSSAGTSTSVGFIPFPMVTSEKSVTIHAEHIVFVVDPAEDFLSQYSQIFGEILTARPSIVV